MEGGNGQPARPPPIPGCAQDTMKRFSKANSVFKCRHAALPFTTQWIREHSPEFNDVNTAAGSENYPVIRGNIGMYHRSANLF